MESKKMITQLSFFRRHLLVYPGLLSMSKKLQVSLVTRTLLISMLFILSSLISWGQNDITISLTIPPPYTPKIIDYFSQQNKIMLTIKNNTGNRVDAYMQVTITDNAAITASSDPGFRRKLTLEPYGSFRMNQTNYEQVINTDHILYKGITKQQVAEGNIPEGEYSLCISAFDVKNNLLSGEDMGCFTFTIRAVEPPATIRPECGINIKEMAPQNLLLSWTIPVGAPAITDFTVKIIEVYPTDKNLVEAMLSLSHQVFFEKKTNINSCLLGPADPALIIGKRYAFAVIASDPNKVITFNNNGMSNVCDFTYGGAGGSEIIPDKTESISIQLLEPGFTIQDLKPSFKWQPSSEIKGVLYTLKIVEVDTTKSPLDLMQNSKTLWSVAGIKENFLRYPLSNPALDSTKIYAWSVTAIGKKGAVLGKSEMGLFGYSTSRLLRGPSDCSLTPVNNKTDYYVCVGGTLYIPPPTYTSNYGWYITWVTRYWQWTLNANPLGPWHWYLSGGPTPFLFDQNNPNLLVNTNFPGTYTLHFHFEVGPSSNLCVKTQDYTIHVDGPYDAKVVDINSVPPCATAPMITDICEGQDAKLVIPHLWGSSNSSTVTWSAYEDFTGNGCTGPFIPLGTGNPKPINPTSFCSSSMGHYTRCFKVGYVIASGVPPCEDVTSMIIWCHTNAGSITTDLAPNVCVPTPGNACSICETDIPRNVTYTLNSATPGATINWTNNIGASPGTGLTYQLTIPVQSIYPATVVVTAHVTNGPFTTGPCGEKTTTYTITVYPKLTGSISCTKQIVCPNDDAVMTLTGLAAGVPVHIQWEYSSNGSSWVPVANMGDGTQQQTNEIGDQGFYNPIPHSTLCWRAHITNPLFLSGPCGAIDVQYCFTIKQPPCLPMINCPSGKHCLGTSVLLTTYLTNIPPGCDNTGLVYSWQRDGLPYGPPPSTTNTSLNVTEPGTYSVTVSNGCESVTSHNCKVEFCIFDLAISAPCCTTPGSTITLSAIHPNGSDFSTCGGPYTFIWNVPSGFTVIGGIGTPQITGIIAPGTPCPSIMGPFSVTVTDGHPCSGKASTDVLICCP